MTEEQPTSKYRPQSSIKLIIIFGIALTLILFGDVIFGLKTLVPVGLLNQIQPWRAEFQNLVNEPPQQYDQLFQFYPWAHFFKNSIHSGVFPLWNPYNYLGTPFFANPQTALLFPLTWIHLIFPLFYSFNLVIVCKFLLALFGMAFWLRYLRLSAAATLLGATVFAVSMDTMVSLAYPYSTVTVLFPWLLLATARCLDNPNHIGFGAVTTIVTLTVLAGQPQSALIAFLGIGLFVVFRLFGKEIRFSRTQRSLIVMVLAFILAGGITTVQTIPAFEYTAESGVTTGPRIAHTGLPNPPGSLLTLLIPDLFGTPYQGDFWGFPGYQHSSFYSSILALILIPIAIWNFRKSKGSIFPISLGLISIFLMIGTIPFEYLFELPGFDLIKRNKLPFFLVFGIAELSARGLDQLGVLIEKRKLRNLRTIIFSMFLILIGLMSAPLYWYSDFLKTMDPNNLVVANFVWTGLFLLVGTILLVLYCRFPRLIVLFVLLVVVDLGIHSYPLNPRGTLLPKFPAPSMTSVFEAELPRIYSTQNFFQPNTNLLFQLQDVRGYDVMTPERLFRFMQRIDPNLGNYYRQVMRHDSDSIHSQTRMRRSLDKALDHWGLPLIEYLKEDIFWSVKVDTIKNQEFFDLLQIQYLLSGSKILLDDYQEIGRIPFRIYHNLGASYGRIYHSWETVSKQNVLDRMERVDLNRTVVVETELPNSEQGTESTGSVFLEEESIHRKVIRVKSESPSVVVLFDRFSSGWQAFLNGTEELPVFPAHYIFRGVHVPAGEHKIEFRYQPRTVRVGLMLSLASMVVTVLIFFRLRPLKESIPIPGSQL